MALTFPTVHLNGTGGERLLEQQRDVCQALHAALDALREASPNGRDYYVQGNDVFAQAAREHRARIEAIKMVLGEAEKIAHNISEQIDARKRR